MPICALFLCVFLNFSCVSVDIRRIEKPYRQRWRLSKAEMPCFSYPLAYSLPANFFYNGTCIIFKRPCHSLPPPYSTILPSSMRTIRSARRAMSLLWVIITTVCRNSALVRLISPSTSALVLLSRLPVGSSASTIAGFGNQGAGNRHTLLLAAGKIVRHIFQFIFQPQQVNDLVQKLLIHRVPV